MKIKLNKVMSMSLFAIMLMLALNSMIYPIFTANWRECLNSPGCTCYSSTSVLKPYILDSAGYFLNSHSVFQTLLNRVELAEINGIDSRELNDLLCSAIDSMEKSKMAYTNFKIESEKIPYDQVMVDKLMKFDYNGFRIKYGLVEPIFAKVKTFLSKGDIPGLDMALMANMDTILSTLYEIKTLMDKDQVPQIALLWRANQAYAEAQLFGQYMSEIFKANI